MLNGRGITCCDAYKAFNPLMRLRGTLLKMHVLKLTKYPRLLYLNPIEGVLITYKTANKFPHQPNYVMCLNQVTTLEFMLETKWYFSRGCYYMQIATKDKTQVFLADNLDVINFWVNQISLAIKFYNWLQALKNIHYKIRQAHHHTKCDVDEFKCSIDAADTLINKVMTMTLPEVNIDQYSAQMQISANDYAMLKVTEHMASIQASSGMDN